MSLTVEQIIKLGSLAKEIEDARYRVERAELMIEKIKEHCKAGTAWSVTLQIKPASNNYSSDEVKINVTVPLGVVQQQAIYALGDARRALVQLEMQMP